MPKVLVVEDDAGLRQIVTDLLSGLNYTVDGLDAGDKAIDWLKAYHYDVIILDWELPGASGVEVCREFRRRGGLTPILMLTCNAKIAHKEEAYASGADDYLAKPFHYRELLLRVGALLKRVPELRSQTVAVRGLVLDQRSYCVKRGDEEIQLSRREWQLLNFLMCRPDQFFPSETILNSVWESDSDATAEALRTCIKRLRKKLDNPDETSIIASVRALGYKIDSAAAPSNKETTGPENE